MNAPPAPPCGAHAIFWPDDEGCDAHCILPLGHEPTDTHEDAILGAWDEDELITSEPTGEVPP